MGFKHRLRERFAGKWVLVSGAASGIGLSHAELLAEAGAHLWLIDIKQAELTAVAERLRHSGAQVVCEQVDVSSFSEVVALSARVHEKTDSLALLVNSAGIIATGGVLTTSMATVERIVQVNLLGVVHMMKSFLPAMMACGQGHVINIASASGLVGFPSIAAYSMSKFGVVGLSEATAPECAERGVKLTYVCPGLVNTGLWQSRELTARGRESLRQLLSKQGIPPVRVAEASLEGALAGRLRVVVGYAGHLSTWASRLMPERAPHWVRAISRKFP